MVPSNKGSFENFTRFSFIRTIPEKKIKQVRGLWGSWGWENTFLKKNPGTFSIRFLTFTLEFQKNQSGNYSKFCYAPWKFYSLKPRHLELPHDFFLISPAVEIPFCFLVNLETPIHLLAIFSVTSGNSSPYSQTHLLGFFLDKPNK